METVLIAMSGGVDSSVAAYLIKQQGYSCIGVTMKFFQRARELGCIRSFRLPLVRSWVWCSVGSVSYTDSITSCDLQAVPHGSSGNSGVDASLMRVRFGLDLAPGIAQVGHSRCLSSEKEYWVGAYRDTYPNAGRFRPAFSFLLPFLRGRIGFGMPCHFSI